MSEWPYSVQDSVLVSSESRVFTGQRTDATGLIYLHARYYDPMLGRFISPDPTVSTTRLVGLNRYGYAGNDPVNNNDIDGLGWFEDIKSALRDFFAWGDRELSQIPIVGGLLGIAWRMDPLYAITTGDYEGWVRATATGLI